MHDYDYDYTHLRDMETDELVAELESCRYDYLTKERTTNRKIAVLYELRRTNNSQFDEKFAEFVYSTIGRIL